MITKDALERSAAKAQTSDLNVARQYCQHLFLSYFYQSKGSEKTLFKGGTALKIIYGSPRFSEDLDFSGFAVPAILIEDLLEKTFLEIEREGIEVEIGESKKTTGGYLSIVSFVFLGYDIRVQIEISLRGKDRVQGVTSLITSDLVPSYTLLHLPEDLLVVEKFEALFRRKAARDFFDLYFILRSRLSIPDDYRKKHKLKERLLRILDKEQLDFKEELKLFLPVSHHGILRDFETTLKREIERYI